MILLSCVQGRSIKPPPHDSLSLTIFIFKKKCKYVKRPKKCSAKNWKYVKWCEKLEVCDISQENWKYMIRVLRVPSETLGKHYFQQNPQKNRAARALVISIINPELS